MKRKTFVKQLMALGISRNKANKLCLEALESAAKYRESGLPVMLAWEFILSNACDQFVDIFSLEKEITWRGVTCDKYCWWLTKRSKEHPGRSWVRSHPGM